MMDFSINASATHLIMFGFENTFRIDEWLLLFNYMFNMIGGLILVMSRLQAVVLRGWILGVWQIGIRAIGYRELGFNMGKRFY